MSRKYLAVITVTDDKGFNDLREIAGSFLSDVPDWVDSIRISEATELMVYREGTDHV